MEADIVTTNQNVQLVGIDNPDGVMDIAIRAAKTLERIVSQKKKPVIMNGEQYLEYEDWQTLGQFYGVTAITGEAILVEIDGVKGAKANAKLINFRTGEIVGGAEAYCMRDEEGWSTRPKYEYQNNERVKISDEPVPWFQLASMAQTRAGAKSLRNRLAWVAVLAGYKPTPAEEMTGTEVQHDQAGHWCKKHNTAFFKRGKMKAFAHPVAGSKGEWCSEPVDKTEKLESGPSPAIRNLGDLFGTCTKIWPEKFATKDDVLRFINKRETDIVDPAAEYAEIEKKLAVK